MMYYVYILQSLKDKGFYVGYSNDLRERLKLHNLGRITSTKSRRPFKLIYYEACLNQQDAIRREKYLKSSWGKKYIKNRLKFYLTGFTPWDRCLSNGVKEKNLNMSINGHIDVLQIRSNKIYVMDFKPNASRENEQKVASQLFWYATGLAFRTGIPLRNFTCAPAPLDKSRSRDSYYIDLL